MNSDNRDVVIYIEDNKYDSLNRKVLQLTYHINMGFSITEKVYDSDMIKTYEYPEDTLEDYDDDEIKMNRQIALKPIITNGELEKLEGIKNLYAGKKRLSEITYLDSNKKVIKKISFNLVGETSSITTYKYNKWNKKEYINLQYEATKWETFFEYDMNGNKVKWARVKSYHDKSATITPDTSEVYYYKYSKTNKVIEEAGHDEWKRYSKVTYEYNKLDQLIKKTTYKKNKKKILEVHFYAYDNNGNEIEEVYYDYKKSKTKPEYIIKTEYEFWE